jgi:hypothetical protein
LSLDFLDQQKEGQGSLSRWPHPVQKLQWLSRRVIPGALGAMVMPVHHRFHGNRRLPFAGIGYTLWWKLHAAEGWKANLVFLMLLLIFVLGNMLYDEWKAGRINLRRGRASDER